jgi:hypothetical protein
MSYPGSCAPPELFGWRTSIPTFGQVFTRIMRTRTGRVGVLVAWVWIGPHFFAK